MTDPNETAKRPVTYDDARGGILADQAARYAELSERGLLADAIARRKARSTHDPASHVNYENFPPLTVAERLEMLAIGESLARYYRHPTLVHYAVTAGATWDQVAAATGSSAEAARAAYREWAEGQHRLHADTGAGLKDDEYAAALAAAEGS
jgi:hypothetical protein